MERAGKAGVAISLVSGLDIGNFRQVMIINKIVIKERPLPSDAELVARLRERLQVKVEQEIRHLSPSDQALQVDRFLPAVEALAATDEGRRDLAAICGSYLREHRPETAVREGDTPPSTAVAASAPYVPGTGGPPGGGRRRRSGGGGGGGRRGGSRRR